MNGCTLALFARAAFHRSGPLIFHGRLGCRQVSFPPCALDFCARSSQMLAQQSTQPARGCTRPPGAWQSPAKFLSALAPGARWASKCHNKRGLLAHSSSISSQVQSRRAGRQEYFLWADTLRCVGPNSRLCVGPTFALGQRQQKTICLSVRARGSSELSPKLSSKTQQPDSV